MCESKIAIFSNEFGFETELTSGGNFVKIKSRNDVWYIENREYAYKVNSITLYHQNTFGSGGWHKQKRFKTIYEVFCYIASHDKKYEYNNK